MNKLIKITALLLIQTFFLMDLSYSARQGFFIPSSQKNTISSLSPQLNLNELALSSIFKDFINIPLAEKLADADDFEQSFLSIVENFLDQEDEMTKKLTGNDSVRAAAKKISKMIKERIAQKKQTAVDPYFITGVMCLLSGLGGGGKTTVALEMIELLNKELPDCYIHPRLQFDYYILPSDERITYYGISAKQDFSLEVLNILIENDILKEDASDKYYVFWLKNNVTAQNLTKLGLSSNFCKSVLDVWEKIPIPILRS